ncbi:hypothetical protein GGQ92_001223 [Gracilibacillus halotolerans]|uniref:Uncharacterized protein n=1 Tax=Gracilibacillus halotolerans TaxID=74386 RepID=A0A841REJ1_9BACI|nr:hypothetical protein [Gracilibacillus halotolerans]MBB6512440.1 hypothetical protein [Gracilibacillus halotolerans]
MNIPISYIIAALAICFIVILISRDKGILYLQKEEKYKVSKRLLLGSYLATVSITCFVISFVMNLFIYMQILQSKALSSNNTIIACFLFLGVFLIAEYGIKSKRTIRSN